MTEKDITIKGKTTSQYLASVVVDNLPPRPFNIRMRRMTPDSTTDQLQNKTLWSSYTEIIDVKQCYPNTALVGVQVDSEQFGSQQVSRNYHLRGRILRCRRTITRRLGNTAVSGTERLSQHTAITWPGVCGIC